MSKFDAGADFSKPAKAFLEHRDIGLIEDENGERGWVEVLSSKHPNLQRLERKAKQEGVRRANDIQRGKRVDASLDDIEQRNLEYLCAAVTDWRIVNLAGKHMDIPCTEENKRELFSDPAWDFVRTTVDAAVANDQVFMPNSRLYSQNTQEKSSSLGSRTKKASATENTSSA